MIGFIPDNDGLGNNLLRARPHDRAREIAPVAAALLILGFAVLMLLSQSRSPAEEPTLNLNVPGQLWYGVTLGGWLVMEINPAKADGIHPDMRPHWMFDEIAARSELDFVSELRSEHGDAYAIATMANHWEHYYTDVEIDSAQALGVNTVRIPIGYWIMDAPVGGGSPEDYGFSPEGFVTGGLRHLRRMLVKLQKRQMTALLDLHAHPCNSACVSNGLACLGPLAFTPDGGVQLYDDLLVNTISDIPKCPIGADGPRGVYPTTRKPTAAAATWGDVAVNSVGALAAWVAALPSDASRAISAVQLANEPALGPPGIFDAEINRFYERALLAARAHLPTTPLLMSFMHPLPTVIDFLRASTATSARLADGAVGAEVLADHHYYLNWQVIAATPGAALLRPPSVPSSLSSQARLWFASQRCYISPNLAVTPRRALQLGRNSPA